MLALLSISMKQTCRCISCSNNLCKIETIETGPIHLTPHAPPIAVNIVFFNSKAAATWLWVCHYGP